MSDSLRLISKQELAPYACAGNAFARIEDARAVAQKRPGAEVIHQQGASYVLYAADRLALGELGTLAAASNRIPMEFISFGNQVLNLDNPEGIRGVGRRLSSQDLQGLAAKGNAFARFTHAEAVAKKLHQDTAIVWREGTYQLFAISRDSSDRLLAGQNDLLDTRVTAVVRKSATLYNWGAERSTTSPHPGFAYASKGQLLLDGQPFTIRGLNVYDLVEVGMSSEAELRETLQLMADTGINSVRMLALDKHPPEAIAKVLDTAREMGLKMKFIPVLGNHWQHVEAEHSHFVKDATWYRQGFEQYYWPHAEATIKALMDRPEILMWELMNEPEAPPEVLRGFADEVSSRIRAIYDQRERETGKPVPHHLISLGTLGVGNNDKPRPGMAGHDYKNLYGLPHLDVATVHDYTKATLSDNIAEYMHYARDLNKPFFLGEIGVKVRKGGTDTQPVYSLFERFLGYKADASHHQAISRLQEKIQASAKAGSAGAMLWGPQPRGHAVDGDGYGFNYDRDKPEFKQLISLFGSW
ncbi:MAG TPA: cellulase family glycosylhydrolase [Candidatus Obscuribacterales bacterium]